MATSYSSFWGDARLFIISNIISLKREFNRDQEFPQLMLDKTRPTPMGMTYRTYDAWEVSIVGALL